MGHAGYSPGKFSGKLLPIGRRSWFLGGGWFGNFIDYLAEILGPRLLAAAAQKAEQAQHDDR